MTRQQFSLCACFAVAVTAGTTAALCQTYPVKPVRIVTFEAGGSVDLIARIIALGLSAAMGQSVFTENRPSIIAIETVARAQPDGYNLLVAGGTLWLAPLVQNTSFDPIKDFAPVSLLTRSVNVLVVHPSLPVRSVGELIDLAKSRRGELNFSTDPIGSSTYLTAHLFKSMSGTHMVGIPYRGTGPALTALLSGEVQFTFGTPGSLAPHIKSGRLRALAVTSAEPSVLFPGLPTVAASGLPGYEVVASQGIFVPAGVAAGTIQRLNDDVVRFIRRPEIRDRFLSLGLETVGSAPDRLAFSMQSEITKWSKVIKETRMRAD